jgi:DNA-binding NtrC family response regulator
VPRTYQSGIKGDISDAAFSFHDLLMAVILIVEDEIFIRQSAEGTIEDLGHIMLSAEDLDGALLHLSAPQQIDVLFVDIRLDALALGGYDVANQGIKIRPEMRVLYTSGTPFTSDMSKLFVDGGQFLQKPYSPAQLEHSLGELLH